MSTLAHEQAACIANHDFQTPSPPKMSNGP